MSNILQKALNTIHKRIFNVIPLLGFLFQILFQMFFLN